jgi:hypothetical protein
MKRTPPIPPRIEIWGGCLLGMARGLESQGVAWPQVLELLGRSGIFQPQKEAWYPLPNHLAFLAEVEREHGREVLRVMGRFVPDAARFPPEPDTLEQALHLLDVAYQVNHRRGNIGRYHCQSLAPGHAEMLCENPYPCELDQGILERILERFGGAREALSVTHRSGPHCRRLGAKACLYDLRW